MKVGVVREDGRNARDEGLGAGDRLLCLLQRRTCVSLVHLAPKNVPVGLKLDPVNVARQLGHSDPAITLSTYSHLCERARHADEMRQALGDGFGHLLSAESN